MTDQFFSEDDLAEIVRKQLFDAAREEFRKSLFGMSTSTEASVPLPPLTVDTIKEAARMLETHKANRREKVAQSAGVMGPFGIKIFVNPYCYKTRVEVRGLADVRKPNRKKMLYRKVTVLVPIILLTKEGIICPPSVADEIRRKLAAGEMVIAENIGRSK